ncbi:molybdopterin-guanine dinucleotide biosynthesis protein B [Myxococcaceae bacterium GXIMD 01537]
MRPPALSFIGWSGSGKTTLLTRLVPELRARGLRVGVVKHTSDAHPLHKPGSDSAQYSRAGAALVAYATPSGVQLTLPEPPADALVGLLARFADRVDVVLVEGWKDGPLPKVEVWREDHGPLLAPSHPETLAVVTDAADVELPAGVRRFGTSELPGLAVFVARFAEEQSRGA